MYEYLKGTLVSQDPIKVIIDVNGVGFQVLMPLSCLNQLPLLGKEVTVYTKLIVREDAHTLFGFLSPQERNLFEKLINVSGIGPKTGLALLGHLDPLQLHQAIQNGDVKTLSKVPGIGKKTAERLLVDMRDHLESPHFLPRALGSHSLGKTSVVADAIQGLMQLGYSAFQAQKAIHAVLAKDEEPKDPAVLITRALKKC